MPRWTFFLGGRDLEMVTIRDLLADRSRTAGDVRVIDRELSWSDARASAFADEIRETIHDGSPAVLVELKDDLPADFPRLASLSSTTTMNGPARDGQPRSSRSLRSSSCRATSGRATSSWSRPTTVGT